ncbi:MAG: 3-deoxy-manno-octulosonate cytidylyltransferase [Gemmataceae bacterium]
MRVDIVIPARYGATRLAGKPLLRATGKYLVQHVYERAKLSKRARNVIIATDDARIEAAVKSFGADCVMTSRDHLSGTDRIAEVARQLDSDVVINLQGDEPEIEPAALDMLPDLLERDPEATIATAAAAVPSLEAFNNPACVKVVCDHRGRALYFSRSPIPYVRDAEPDFKARPARFLQHLGLYAFRRKALFEIAALPPEPLELSEKLEQLRALATGRIIQVGIVNHAARGVDTFEDYERFRRSFARVA